MPFNPNSLDHATSAIIPISAKSANLLTHPTSITANTMSPNHHHSSTPNNNSAGGTNQQQQKNPKLYKTELCRSWMEHGRCNYGERCQYAHGHLEKRTVPRHPKYKTEACQSYHKTGYCPYGPRCHFVHNESQTQLKLLIEQNEKALRMVQELASSPIIGKPLTFSPSSASLGNFISTQYDGLSQKNNSMHSFPNGFPNQFFGRAQSFGNSPPQHHLNDRSPVGCKLLGSDSYSKQQHHQLEENYWHAHQQQHQNSQENQNLAPFDQFHLFPQQRSTELLSQMTTWTHQKQQNSQHVPLNSNSASPLIMSMNNSEPERRRNNEEETKLTREEEPIHKELAQLCLSGSDDDDCSRSSLMSSSVVDSGTESPLVTFNDNTLTKSASTKKFADQQLLMENDKQRRSSDGENTHNETIHAADRSLSTASSSLASLLSSSSSSQTQQTNKLLYGTSPISQSNKIRLPVFERLSLNQ